MSLWLPVLAGAAAGLLGALGMGGGGVLVLYLTEAAGVDQMAAQGVNLLFFIPTAAVALALHAKNKLIQWRLLPWAVGGGLAGVGAGAFLAGYLGAGLVSKLFACMIIGMGIRELWAK